MLAVMSIKSGLRSYGGLQQFFSLVLDDTWNTRTNDLLCSLNLESIFLKLNDDIKDAPINYAGVDVLLEKRRENSMNFLTESLK